MPTSQKACTSAQLQLSADHDRVDQEGDVISTATRYIIASYNHDPLRRLPYEIISHIFRHALPNFSLQERTEYWPSDREEGPPSEPWVLTLGAVCRLWREVAWSTSDLWSVVMLSLGGEPTDTMVEVLGQWLTRAKQQPLSIRLYFGEGTRWTSDKNNSQQILDSPHSRTNMLISKFNSVSPRWQDLSLQCDWRQLELFTGCEAGVGGLKTMQLLPRKWRHDHELTWPISKIGARGIKLPRPDHIIAVGYCKVESLAICVENVTVATIACLTLSQCIQLLADCPRLVHLHLENIDYSPPHELSSTITSKPHVVPHLQILFISTDLWNLQAFWTSFSAPSLEELRISGTQCQDYCPYPRAIPFSARNIAEFLERSSPPQLSTFAIEYGKCDVREIIALLSSLPASLRNIELDVRHIEYDERDLDLDILFDHLASSQFLPNLESFQYLVFGRTTPPWVLVLDFVYCPTESGQRRALKELAILSRDSVCLPDPFEVDIPPEFLPADPSLLRGLAGLQDDGVDLYAYLPCRLTLELVEEL